MKPIVVYDPLTGNGWYHDEATGDKLFYDKHGVLRRVIHGEPAPAPVPQVSLGPAPGYSQSQRNLADQQKADRARYEAEIAHNRQALGMDPTHEPFDLKGAVKGLLDREGI